MRGASPSNDKAQSTIIEFPATSSSAYWARISENAVASNTPDASENEMKANRLPVFDVISFFETKVPASRTAPLSRAAMTSDDDRTRFLASTRS